MKNTAKYTASQASSGRPSATTPAAMGSASTAISGSTTRMSTQRRR